MKDTQLKILHYLKKRIFESEDTRIKQTKVNKCVNVIEDHIQAFI